jgi:hypothetical protein
MEPIGSPEASVSNHLTSGNNPEDGRIRPHVVRFRTVWWGTASVQPLSSKDLSKQVECEERVLRQFPAEAERVIETRLLK